MASEFETPLFAEYLRKYKFPGYIEKREYDQRFEKARQLMGESGIDALLVTNHANTVYFGGVEGVDFRYVDYMPLFPFFVLVLRDSEPVKIIRRSFDRLDMGQYIKDVRYYDNKEGYTEEPDYVNVISDLIREKNLDHGQIGIEMGYAQRLGFPLNEYFKLTKKLPNAEFLDGSHIINRLRMVKSPAEVSYIREACEAAEKGLESLLCELKEGMTEWEAVKIFWSAAVKAGGKPAWHQVYSTGHAMQEVTRFSADVPLKRGSLVYFDMGLTYGGYNCDICRLFVIGKASPLQKKAAEFAREVTKESIEAIKPGMKCSEALDASRKACNRVSTTAPSKIKKAHVFGDWLAHGIGLWMSEPPRIASYDHTMLEPGMTFAVEPFMTTKDFAITIEENVVITEEGCEILSKASTELHEV